MFPRLKDFLNKPYAALTPFKSRLVFVLGFLVLGIFLMIAMNPFNIRKWLELPKWISFFGLSGMAIVSSLVLVISQWIIRPWLNIKVYKRKHLCYTILIEVFVITIVLAAVYGDHNNSWWGEYLSTTKFSLVGTFLPYSMALLMAHFVGSNNVDKTLAMPEMIHVKDEKDQVKLSLQPNDLLYLESMGNYVQVHYKDVDGVSTESVRITLKKMAEQLTALSLVRCHRSFIIHTPSIQVVKKEGGTLKIFLNDVRQPIPVSRSFEGAFQSYLM